MCMDIHLYVRMTLGRSGLGCCMCCDKEWELRFMLEKKDRKSVV